VRDTGPTKCQSKVHDNNPPAAEGTFDLSWPVLDADADVKRTASTVKRLCHACLDTFRSHGGTAFYHRFN
jgi:hypothetical protein